VYLALITPSFVPPYGRDSSNGAPLDNIKEPQALSVLVRLGIRDAQDCTVIAHNGRGSDEHLQLNTSDLKADVFADNYLTKWTLHFRQRCIRKM